MRHAPRTVALAVGSSADDALDRVIGIAPAPLLIGERQTDYAGVARRIVQASRPRDAVEEFLLRDVIDLTWEILRLRRVKAGTIKASMSDGVKKVLGNVGHDWSETNSLSEDWAGGDKRARGEVDTILAKAGLTMEEVTAKTFESKIDVFERIDRMSASAEARRNNALREIDRHRETVGTAARKAIDEVEDVEFREVDIDEVTEGPPLDEQSAVVREPRECGG
jgi:hypothetical protein